MPIASSVSRTPASRRADAEAYNPAMIVVAMGIRIALIASERSSEELRRNPSGVVIPNGTPGFRRALG
jgi:hypothetical protein